MSASTLLCSILLATASPGDAWQPCRGEYHCIPGTSMCTSPSCNGSLECMEIGGGTMCVPQCKSDIECIEYVPEAPNSDAGPQCFGGLCIVQCGDPCPAGLTCVAAFDDEGVCVWEDGP